MRSVRTIVLKTCSCPVDYDPLYLEAIPDEVIELDCGCGDPSRYLQRGDATVQGVAEPGSFPVRRSDVLPHGTDVRVPG
jgi:hypothetical protein